MRHVTRGVGLSARAQVIGMVCGILLPGVAAQAQVCGEVVALPQAVDAEIANMRVFDLGDGPKLYAVGTIRSIGGRPARGLIRWDGAAWTELATSGAERTTTLEAHNDGTGPAVYVLGSFSTVNGVTASGIARWSPSLGWRSVSGGEPQSFPSSLVVHDPDGAGALPAMLYASSSFSIARWNGTAWESVPRPLEGANEFIFSIDEDGAGANASVLYSLSNFTVNRFDGTTWTSTSAFTGSSSGFGVIAEGDREYIYSTGSIGAAMRRWTGTAWQLVPNSPNFSGSFFPGREIRTQPNKDVLAAASSILVGSSGVTSLARRRNGVWEAIPLYAGGSYVSSGAAYTAPDGTTSYFIGGDFDVVSSNGVNVPSANIARLVLCPAGACSADYNNDGDSGTDADIEAFFACLAGNCCATCPADFDNDGVTGTDTDIEAFFRVLAGGSCN